jgi:hypothetical protein
VQASVVALRRPRGTGYEPASMRVVGHWSAFGRRCSWGDGDAGWGWLVVLLLVRRLTLRQVSHDLSGCCVVPPGGRGERAEVHDAIGDLEQLAVDDAVLGPQFDEVLGLDAVDPHLGSNRRVVVPGSVVVWRRRAPIGLEDRVGARSFCFSAESRRSSDLRRADHRQGHPGDRAAGRRRVLTGARASSSELVPVSCVLADVERYAVPARPSLAAVPLRGNAAGNAGGNDGSRIGPR